MEDDCHFNGNYSELFEKMFKCGQSAIVSIEVAIIFDIISPCGMNVRSLLEKYSLLLEGQKFNNVTIKK